MNSKHRNQHLVLQFVGALAQVFGLVLLVVLTSVLGRLGRTDEDMCSQCDCVRGGRVGFCELCVSIGPYPICRGRVLNWLGLAVGQLGSSARTCLGGGGGVVDHWVV